nr:glucokinase [Ignavibacteria bacterium]
ELDEQAFSQKFKIGKFRFSNDLESLATSVPFLPENELIKIYNGDGTKREANKAVIAPGTGLGQSALNYSKNKYICLPTEGGHTDFAPSNETEIELLRFLLKKYDHVSYERIICGSGMINIFDFLRSTNKFDINEELIKRIETDDSASVISSEGLSKKSEICEKTIDIFVSILGAQAGNMVLNFKATGGIYLGGGIPVKILNKFKEEKFIQAFLNKGRLSYLCEVTPVYIIKNESAGITGAAIIASRL